MPWSYPRFTISTKKKRPATVTGTRRVVRGWKASKFMWKSLLNPNKIYRHVVRGVPFYITNNFNGGGLGSGTSMSLPLQFGTLVNASEFDALYDSYRIMSVKYTFFPLANSHDMAGLDSTLNYGQMQPLFYVIDYDDATPYNINQMFQCAGMKSVQYGKRFAIKFRPHVNTDVSTPISLSRQSVKSPWLDIANTTTQHFGVKFHIDDCHIGTNNLYVVHTECCVEFRGQR